MTAIYLDNAASTQTHPDVLGAMMPYLADLYGNPSSIHRSGRMARKAVGKARRQVASLLHAEPSEIFFTSGGTESNNAALRGIARAASYDGRCRIITSTVEHDAILEPCRGLEQEGMASIEYVPVDRNGTVNIGRLADMLDVGSDACDHSQAQLHPARATTLVSIMCANNEVGTIQDVHEIARVCHRAGAIFHTDAVQAAGKIPVDVKEIGADAMSVSSHKIYGPKGVGALYVSSAMAPLAPQILGGGQENGARSGTENVAGIVGFGAACEIARDNLDRNMTYTCKLRDMMARRILDEIPESVMNGDTDKRLPGNAHFTFLGVNGEDLLIKLDERGVAASTGSACSVNTQKASHVLEAMGFTHEQITGSLRLTLGAFNTPEEINCAVDILEEVVHELRMVSPFKSKYAFGSHPRPRRPNDA